MKTAFECEVCGGTAAQPLGTRSYSLATGGRCDEYQRKRLRVLFEIWCPGEQDVEFTAVMCRSCGFVCHLPRAESSDLDAKYRALLSWGQDYGRDEVDEVAQQRSQDLYLAAQVALTGEVPFRILDYGGGDGRLMRAFTSNCHETFLVDYNENPVAGVHKLADTLDTLPACACFDLIVASHVLEHVAEPTKVVRELAGHLGANGHLFVEVPMEIWGGPPFHDEPVTHVNFFVRGSLRRCFEEASLDVVSCRLTRSLHPTGQFKLAVQVLGQKSSVHVLSQASGVREVDAFLAPSVRHRLKRRMTLTGGIRPMLSHTIQTRVLGCREGGGSRK